MPKSLLQQAIENNDLPAGTIQKGNGKKWKRLLLPKNNSKCPLYGKEHKRPKNVYIRPYDDGYEIRCFAKRCQHKSIYGYSEEEMKKIYGTVEPTVYSADMF